MLDRLLSFIADILGINYVVEEGVSNGWTYTIWKNGKTELSGAFVLTGTETSPVFGAKAMIVHLPELPMTLTEVTYFNSAGRLGTGYGISVFLHVYNGKNPRLTFEGNQDSTRVTLTAEIKGKTSVGGV